MIPLPLNLKLDDGKFILDSNTKIYAQDDLFAISEYLKRLVEPPTGFNLKNVSKRYENNSLNLELDDSLRDLNPEGYLLKITPEFIIVSAPQPAGVFYGVQTLRQLLPIEIESQETVSEIEWNANCIHIEDYPRFKWRGFMFDSGRHFYNTDVIKKYLDLIASLKMNIFHWHLTEDQGWRIEIEKYPKLTEIGSKRSDTQIGGWRSKKTRGEPHEGYYTKEEIRDVIRYAEERFVRVVPEIDIPGHSSAAIASYPKLSCTKDQIEVPITSGIKDDVYCAGQEYTYEFLKGVFDEVLELFPSEVIHIGGDEVPKKHWKECSVCKQKMKEENLSNVHELQTYFTDRITKYLSSKGRRVIGWNEILTDKIDRNIIGQYWMFTGKKNVVKHLKSGGEVIVSNLFRYYLDYSYIMTPLRKTYNFEPVSKGFPKQNHEQILGIEAPIWTEWVPNTKRLDWQVLPRLVAVAETAWTQKKLKNFNNFRKRLESFVERIKYFGLDPAPLSETNPNTLKRLLNISKAFKWPEI